MFELVSAFIATSYVFSVLLCSFSIVSSFDNPVIREAFTKSLRRYLLYLEGAKFLVTELSLQCILMSFVWVRIVSFLGGFNYTLACLMYYVDWINFGGLVMLFLGMLKDRDIADNTIKTWDANSKPIANVLRLEDVKRLLNPVWTPTDIKIHQNITYATNEEIREALQSTDNDYDQPRKMMLDVFTKNTKAKTTGNGLRPVMVHIHGGAWRLGNKNIFYPFEKLMLEEDNWVIVNIGYRLAPKNAYPTHLIDVKRAIRWLKANIASFGGDPDFIVLTGDSAGGHLASMASLTMNDPKYQPGFENVDTSVRGVVALSGALDIASETHHAVYFSKKVANLDKLDVEFLNHHSPLQLVPGKKETGDLVPHLLVAGEHDYLCESSMSKSFKAAADKVSPGSCSLVLLPGAHHIHYLCWSPRSIYISRVIQSWCRHLYAKNK